MELAPTAGPADGSWGTFAINVSGAFLLGLLFTLFTERISVEAWLRGGLMIGLLGGCGSSSASPTTGTASRSMRRSSSGRAKVRVIAYRA